MYNLVGKTMVRASEFYGACLGENHLQFLKLSDELDLERLQRLFEEADGIRLPIRYLKQGRAFVCTNKNGDVLGGFALIDQGPYRCLEQLPKEWGNLSSLRVTEITALCFTAKNRLSRLGFWSYVIGQALSGPSDELIYAVNSNKQALRERLFNHVRLQTLYEGVVRQLDGMSDSSHEAVELTTKAHLFKGFGKLAYREGKLFVSDALSQNALLPRMGFKRLNRSVKNLSV